MQVKWPPLPGSTLFLIQHSSTQTGQMPSSLTLGPALFGLCALTGLSSPVHEKVDYLPFSLDVPAWIPKQVPTSFTIHLLCPIQATSFWKDQTLSHGHQFPTKKFCTCPSLQGSVAKLFPVVGVENPFLSLSRYPACLSQVIWLPFIRSNAPTDAWSPDPTTTPTPNHPKTR